VSVALGVAESPFEVCLDTIYKNNDDAAKNHAMFFDSASYGGWVWMHEER